MLEFSNSFEFEFEIVHKPKFQKIITNTNTYHMRVYPKSNFFS